MLFSLLKHHLDPNITDTALKVSRVCTVSLLLYLMILKTISPGRAVRASLMLVYRRKAIYQVTVNINNWIKECEYISCHCLGNIGNAYHHDSNCYKEYN